MKIEFTNKEMEMVKNTKEFAYALADKVEHMLNENNPGNIVLSTSFSFIKTKENIIEVDEQFLLDMGPVAEIYLNLMFKVFTDVFDSCKKLESLSLDKWFNYFY